MHICYLFYALIRLTTITFCLLKLEDSLSWSWSAILWPFWLSFSFMVIITLFCVILFLNSVFTYFQDEVEWQAIVGSLWCLLFSCGLS